MYPFRALNDGFASAFALHHLGWAFVGTTIGTAIGVLPGIGPALTVAVLLGLTGLLCVFSAWVGWAGVGRALRVGAPLPGAASYLVVMVGVAVVALLITGATVWDSLR